MAELSTDVDLTHLKSEPIINVTYNKRGPQFIMFLEFCATIIVMLFVNQYFYKYMFEEALWLLFLLPLAIFGLIWQFAGFSLLFSWIILKILRKMEHPKEGEFDIGGREFIYSWYRFWICYYAVWVFRAMPLPWSDMFVFRMFGAKIGGEVVLYDSWIDMEFVEIGDYVMLSLGTSVYSHCIVGDKFIVKKTIVNKNAIVGAEAIIAPGTVIGEGATLGVNSTTYIGQQWAEYRVHVGQPCNKEIPIKRVGNIDHKEKKEGKN